VTFPKTWVRPAQLHVAWAPGESANGPLTYQLVLDGKLVGVPSSGLAYTFARGSVSSGIHDVQVLARDIFGQESLTARGNVKVDGTPPVVRLTRRAHVVTVRVSDNDSGLLPGSVHISFGDDVAVSGQRTAAHRYQHRGSFTIRVNARDRAGNRVSFMRRVSV
jgi:hypothetical protein